ncbi:MAG: uncharacterized protein JWM11_2457, partial [Planctomycetaceae bacterium]|nr:uncharacterized protein [Planctomycetaceae bacterium]
KPRFWNRDLKELGREAIRQTFTHAVGPLTAKELVGRVQSSAKFTERDLAPLLIEMAAQGSLHTFPPAKPNGATRFWDRDLIASARQAIIQSLNDKGPQPVANLKKVAKDLTPEQFESLFQELLNQNDIRQHPPVPGGKHVLFGTRPPVLGPYFKDVSSQLTKVIATLLSANVSNAELRQTLMQLIEDAGIVFGDSALPNDSAAVDSTDFDVIGLMKRLEPGAERGALVGARELRRAAQIEKSRFDTAVLGLARQGKLSLHRHDYPTSLTQDERDDLVTDGAGTYYVGLAIRRSEA